MTKDTLFCSYYTAHIPVQHVWFVIASLKGFEHVAFDRTIDVKKSIFEFFVTTETEDLFCEIMKQYVLHGYVYNLEKKLNRLSDETESV